MKVTTVLLLLASLSYCFGQTDTNIVATGDWSESVRDNHGAVLRGRLLVSEPKNLEADTRARIYLDLQNVESPPFEVYFDIAEGTNGLQFEMQDARGKPIPGETVTDRKSVV